MKNDLERESPGGWNYKKIALTALVVFGGLFAAITNVDKAYMPTFQTIQNPGFEQAEQYWTASGGTFLTSTGNPLFGGAYGSWDASASTQTLCSNSVTVPIGLGNTNGEAYIYSNGTSAYTHTIEVRDGSGNVIASTALRNSPTLDGFTAAKTSLPFLFPTNASSIRLCVVANANEPGIKLDGAYLGAATNIGNVSQARFLGSIKYAATASCSWTKSSTGLFAADTDCPTPTVTGIVTAPGTKIPAAVLPSIPPGKLLIVHRGYLGCTRVSNNCSATYQFTDGTNTTSIVQVYSQAVGASTTELSNSGFTGELNYTAAQGSTTIQPNILGVGGGSAVMDANSADFELSFYYFPNANSTAYTTDESDYGWTPYTPTFTGFGTVTDTLSFYHKRVGDTLFIRGKFTAGTPTATEARITLPSGLTTSSAVQSIEVVGKGNVNAAATTNFSGTSVLIEASKTYFTVGKEGSTQPGTTKANGDAIVGAGNIFTMSAMMPIQGWANTNRAPQLINSVLNTSSGVTRIEAANINCDAGSAITSQHGAWVASVGNVSGGACAITLTTGIFTSTPYCWASPNAAFASVGLILSTAQSSATAVSVDCEDDASGACTAVDFNLFCIGAK